MKVYRLTDGGKWDDRGTGHVNIDFLEVLSCVVSGSTIYYCQTSVQRALLVYSYATLLLVFCLSFINMLWVIPHAIIK